MVRPRTLIVDDLTVNMSLKHNHHWILFQFAENADLTDYFHSFEDGYTNVLQAFECRAARNKTVTDLRFLHFWIHGIMKPCHKYGAILNSQSLEVSVEKTLK